MIVITGGTGQLGGAFRALLPDAVFPTRAELDLAAPAAVSGRLVALAPTALINCAAYAAVDAAEDEPKLARAVNALSVGKMAEYCAARSIPFVTVSTDFVFDGTSSRPYVESDPTAPLGVYGASKLEGERLALGVNPKALVVRTAWLYSGGPSNFVAAVLRRVAGGTAQVVTDQTGSPTLVDDLAPAILAAMDAEAAGLLHLANAGSATRFEQAVAAVQAAGWDAARVEPCLTTDFPTPATRPAYSVLGSERLTAVGIAPMRAWEEGLVDAVPRIVEALKGG